MPCKGSSYGRRVIAFPHLEYISQSITWSEGKQMSSEPLLSSIIPFAGSGLLGYALGFALLQKVCEHGQLGQTWK